MYQAIGQDTQTVYASGNSKADCFRALNDLFPTNEYTHGFKRGKTKNVDVLPEVVVIKNTR